MPDRAGRPTLRDLIAEIEDDIERADLNHLVAKAVERAIRHYQSHRFYFSEGAASFATLPGIDVYGRGDAVALPELLRIDSVVLIENGRTIPLCKISEGVLEAADDAASAGRPIAYSYFDRSLRLWPMPDAEWTVRITGHLSLPVPALDEANGWTDEGSNLIAAFAKRHLAENSLSNRSLAAIQEGVVAREEQRLRARSNVIATTGLIKAYSL